MNAGLVCTHSCREDDDALEPSASYICRVVDLWTGASYVANLLAVRTQYCTYARARA